MLPPRARRQLFCADCGTQERILRLGRVTTRKGQTVLYIRSGNGTMVTDAANENEWIIVCDRGHASIFHGYAVVWNQDWEQAA
jgi:hypothetical protein